MRTMLILSFLCFGAFSQVRYQQGYTRANGTYVQGHMKTKANNTTYDNLNQPSVRSQNNSYTRSKNKNYERRERQGHTIENYDQGY